MTAKEWEEWLSWRRSVDAAIEKLHGGQNRLSDRLELNTKLTQETKISMDELNKSLGGFPAFMSEGHNTFKFVRRLVSLAKWLLVIVVAPVLMLIIVTGHAPQWVHTLWTLIMEFNK